MSRPRSRSPHYRRFPWEEPDFDTDKVLKVLDGNPPERSQRHRKDHEEHWDSLEEDVYSEGQRRPPPFPDDRQFAHHHRPDGELYHRGSSSHYAHRRLSPPRNLGGNGDRRREGFSEHFQSFGKRGRLTDSPPSLMRERLLQNSSPHSDHLQRDERMSWRGEQGKGQGKFRDLSPSVRTEGGRGGAGRERGRRNMQGPNRDRRRLDSHQERSPHFKRQRRELDDTDPLGFRNEEDFGAQRYSLHTPRDGFGGEIHHLKSLVIEHNHGIAGKRESSRWEQFHNHRNLDLEFERRRSPRPQGSSQERFRTSDNRLDDREDMRGRRLQDNCRESNYLETRSSPLLQDRPNSMRFGNREGSESHKGRGSLRSATGRVNRSHSGRTGQPRNPPHAQQSSQGYQDLPHEDQRGPCRPFRQGYDDPMKGESNWTGQWDDVRPASLDRHLPRDGLDPKMPRQREQAWNDQKTSDMVAVKEETLTIKVDMSRPVKQNSLLCYSSDRQLSLDLVNVGRQRLDFLPMLEHSGTYRETAVHTGTFAQEIITLVHQVKEQYFRDHGVTLNERFSAPQKGSEDEAEELTLDERFSSNRGFSLNMNSLLDNDEPLFSRLGPAQVLTQQPVRGPGDLRHDLERRRQERLEGVKVTIPGSSLSQWPLDSVGESGLEYGDEMAELEDEGFSAWPEEQKPRREDNTGPRRGSYRLNSGPQRRNHRFGNRTGPVRRQNNNRNNPTGPNW
ncbi:BCLAF1 and THRAP3 family member 3 [Echeneis naucrates]|uniref:BCLAF1 and THRAP3 family member 3 n=1 Tax=Echeneis naucrates TaxID=173247 RepID=A0A665UQ08_ECHNA|nr:BCLAF1 and THRAP3 family member 3 [Echeneis naucrates]